MYMYIIPCVTQLNLYEDDDDEKATTALYKIFLHTLPIWKININFPKS